MIIFSNAVKIIEVDTKTQWSTLLFDKKNQSTMQEESWMAKTCVEIFLSEFLKSLLFEC